MSSLPPMKSLARLFLGWRLLRDCGFKKDAHERTSYSLLKSHGIALTTMRATKTIQDRMVHTDILPSLSQEPRPMQDERL